MSAKTNSVIALLLILIQLTGLTACSSSADTELSHYISEIKARKARPIEPIPQFPPLAKFTYPESDSRRSPFKPKEVLSEVDKLAPDPNRPKQPLEKFPLDSLKFVGLLKQNAMVWALMSQPNGEVARVKLGDYMGQNFGKVVSINTKSLKLEELVQVEGKWKKQTTTINLNARE